MIWKADSDGKWQHARSIGASGAWTDRDGRWLAVLKGAEIEVWNVANGNVELLYSHSDSDTMDRFAEKLKSGPGRPDSVQVFPAHDFAADEFIIGPTRPS